VRIGKTRFPAVGVDQEPMNVESLGGVVYDITVNLMKDRYPNGSMEVLKSILLLKATVMLKLDEYEQSFDVKLDVILIYLRCLE
jgi:hypothetical protein